MTVNNLNTSLRLTPTDSNVLKGLALLFLLVHHLFYIRNGQFDDVEIFDGHYLVNMIGRACKVCVPLFVFLSGYGLTAATEKIESINLKKIYIRRFSKLYLNYWLIWLLFVPLGVFIFGITFDKVYGNNAVRKFILDFLGLLNITGEYGYNPTWWFYSCITVLYALFPFIISVCRHKLPAHIILWGSVALVFCPWVPVQPIRFYLLTFILGCWFRNGLIVSFIPPPIKKLGIRLLQGTLTLWESVVIVAITILMIPLRMIMPYALVFDTLITIMIVLTYKNIKYKLHPYLSKSLGFCGKHSFNIFLFHTFLFYLYIPQIIYWHRNPIIIFLTLLLLCLSLSWVIEYGKTKLGYYKVLQRINSEVK